MRERICYFLVVLLLIFSGNISGQQVPVNDTVWLMNWDCLGKSATSDEPRKFLVFRQQEFRKMPIRKEVLEGFDFEKMLRLDFAKPASTGPGKPYGNYLLQKAPLAAGYYTAGLGIICKKEWQLDKITPMALRFRLGSLDYVNWMEQKPNAIRPGR